MVVDSAPRGEKKFSRKSILGLVVGVTVLTVSFFIGFRHYENKKREEVSHKRENILKNLSVVHSSYKKRGELIREWSKLIPAKEREEIKVLLSENDGLRLAEPVELKRFEFVQERLNLLISKWSDNSKLAKAKPKNFDTIEWSLNKERTRYATEARALNGNLCRTCRDLAVPQFSSDVISQ